MRSTASLITSRTKAQADRRSSSCSGGIRAIVLNDQTAHIGEHVVDQIARLVTAAHRSAPAKRVHCVGSDVWGQRPRCTHVRSKSLVGGRRERSARGRGMGDQRPPGNQAERPLRRTAGVLRFRSSTDRIFSCTLMRIKICKHSVN
jgi:hypothetical protein